MEPSKNQLTWPCLCFTLKWSYKIGGLTWLTENCSLNNLENWSKEMMWPSESPLNHCRVVPVNVPMNILQWITSVCPEIIIWVLNVVRWFLGSSTDTNQSNQQMTKDTSSTSQKGQSSQYTKLGPTKPRESISRRRSYKPEYHKLFLMVFSIREKLCK